MTPVKSSGKPAKAQSTRAAAPKPGLPPIKWQPWKAPAAIQNNAPAVRRNPPAASNGRMAEMQPVAPSMLPRQPANNNGAVSRAPQRLTRNPGWPAQYQDAQPLTYPGPRPQLAGDRRAVPPQQQQRPGPWVNVPQDNLMQPANQRPRPAPLFNNPGGNGQPPPQTRTAERWRVERTTTSAMPARGPVRAAPPAPAPRRPAPPAR